MAFGASGRILSSDESGVHVVADDTRAELAIKFTEATKVTYVDDRNISGEEKQNFESCIAAIFTPPTDEQPDMIVLGRYRDAS